MLRLFLKQVGWRRYLLYGGAIFIISMLITLIIMHGLIKDQKLLEILPSKLSAPSTATQKAVVFYYFQELFVRAAVLLLEGFLAEQIIAKQLNNNFLMQLLTYPISRTTVVLKMIVAIMIITSGILIIIQSLSIAILYINYGSAFPRTFNLFLKTDWFLNWLFVLISGLPSAIALLKSQPIFIIGSSVLLTVILCNAATSSFQTANEHLLLVLLIVLIIGAGILLTVALKKWQRKDF